MDVDVLVSPALVPRGGGPLVEFPKGDGVTFVFCCIEVLEDDANGDVPISVPVFPKPED